MSEAMRGHVDKGTFKQKHEGSKRELPESVGRWAYPGNVGTDFQSHREQNEFQLYLFPVADVKNDPQRGDLKQQECIPS